MKDLILKKITLKNYRNFKNASFNFGARKNEIRADNRQGKTNLLEAIYYLLTDNLLNSSDIAKIKPLNTERSDTEIVAECDILNGEIVEPIKIKKVFTEIWKAERGSDAETLQGHETHYYINDLELTSKEFKSRLADKLEMPTDTDINILKMLVNPLYIAELGEGKEWQVLRAFIGALVKTDNTDTLINDDLKNFNNIEDLKKYYRQNIKALLTTETENKGKIDILKSLITITDDDYITATDTLKKVNADILRADYERAEKEQLKADILKLEIKADELTKQADKLSGEITTLNDERESIIQQIRDLKPISKCPLCNRKLSPESQKKAIEKAKADLIAKGRKGRAEKESIQVELENVLTLSKNVDDLKNQKLSRLDALNRAESERADKLTDIEKYKALKSDYEKQQEYKAKIEKLKADTKELSKSRIAFEQKLEIAKSYIVEQAKAMTEKQKEIFGKKYFDLVKYNLNGSIEPICKVLVNEKIPYSSASKSERILIGIEILEVLKKLLSLPNLPILFDEGGEISKKSMQKIKTKSQLICVKVADNIEEIEINSYN